MGRILIWQAWSENGSVTFAPVERIRKLRSEGFIPASAVLLHEVKAATGEEAMGLHHEKMGWEPYRPQGEPAPCPSNCGGTYYPAGYGQCPNCGDIS